MLKLEGVKKWYRVPSMKNGRPHWILKERRTVVEDVSLELNAGQIVALTGKSGCGKTTLLNIIAGLTKPSRGRVYYKNRRMVYFLDVMPSLVRNLDMGFIFQTFQLSNPDTVRTNVLMPSLIAGSFDGAVVKRMDMLLDRLGISEFLNTTVGLLSGGQKQRVAIARALINDPALILGDEPTANLDKATSKEIFGILNEIAKKENKGVLMVTHDETMIKKSDTAFLVEDCRLKALP